MERLTLNLTEATKRWTEWATHYWEHWDEANLIIAAQKEAQRTGGPGPEIPNWMKPGGDATAPTTAPPPTPYEKQMTEQHKIGRHLINIGSYTKATARGLEQVTLQAIVHAVVKQEGAGGDPTRRGDSGRALGIGQFWPALQKKYPEYVGASATRQTEILGDYLSELLTKRGGNVEDALSEFHLGATNYARDRFSPANVAYVNSVEKKMQMASR